MTKIVASLFIASAAFVVTAVGGPAPARAEIEYAWCAIGQNQGGQSCSFNTLEQCRSFAFGNGFCAMNPRATVRAEMPRRS